MTSFAPEKIFLSFEWKLRHPPLTCIFIILTSSRMSLSSSAILDWHLCNFPWLFDWRHFPRKVYGRERFYLPDYILRPHEAIFWKISSAGTETKFVDALETCWGDRTYCSRRGIYGTIRSLQKHSTWFYINFSLAHTSAFLGQDWIPFL